MKKNKFLSLLLAAILSMQIAMVPVFAEEETSQTPSESASESAEETLSSEAESVPTEAPVAPSDIPVTTDACVNNGSHSINAKVPMANESDYTAKAKAALLYDINSDTLLYASNPDEQLYPASLTKIMTCMVALELIEEQGVDLNEIIVVPQELVNRVDPNGSSMGLKGDEEIPLIELLYGIMVHSANDACMMVAQRLCGSEEAFVERMNEKAAELGCDQTHFVNVHGLHDEAHYTSARDMAKIMQAAVQNELFTTLYSTAFHEVPATNVSEARALKTTNFLIRESVTDTYYDSRVIGGKTGFTTPAGRCLVTVSEDDSTGMKLICVVMGTKMEMASDGYTVLSYGSFEETKGLLNFAYNNYVGTEVLSDAQTVGQFEVQGGDAAQGKVHGNSGAVLPAGSTLDSIQYEYLLDDGMLTAPVEENQPIGVVRVWYQNKCIAQQELYSASTIKKAVPIAEMPNVDPAHPVETETSVWHYVMIGILALLGVIFVLLVVGHIRRAIWRAKRRKRREQRRRRR